MPHFVSFVACQVTSEKHRKLISDFILVFFSDTCFEKNHNAVCVGEMELSDPKRKHQLRC